MLKVVYEDKYILLAYKPAGLATQTSKVSEKDLVSEVKNYLRKNNSDKSREPYVGLINRLDQPVEGIVLFGLTKDATAELTLQLTSGHITKKYYAAFAGTAKVENGVIVDFLKKDENTNLSRIVDADTEGAKKAVLEFDIVANKDGIGLADIHLITGRHHQIRVQMAGARMPLLGDTKYASAEAVELSEKLGISRVALCSYSLSFTHPKTSEEVKFMIEPRGKWFSLFEDDCARE